MSRILSLRLIHAMHALTSKNTPVGRVLNKYTYQRQTFSALSRISFTYSVKI